MGELGLFTKAHSDYANTPMAKLVEAAMRGNAEMAGVQQAKKVATDQMDANAKTSVTINPARIPGAEPTVTVKNAPTSLLNGTQEQDVQDAYAAPHVAVAHAIEPPAQSNLAGDPNETYEAIDKTLGYHVPRPNDPDVAEKLKTPEGIRALTLEMGGSKQHADQAIAAMRSGTFTVDQMRERVAAYRAQKLNVIYEKAVKGPLDESQQIQQRKQAEADRQTSEARLQEAETRQKQTQADTERQRVLARKLEIVKGTDLPSVDPTQRRAVLEAQNDTGVPFTDAELQRAEQIGQQQLSKKLSDFRKDNAALGAHPTFESAKAAFGYEVPPREAKAFEADYNAARGDYTIKQKNEELKIKAAARDAQRLSITLSNQPSHATAGEAYNAKLDQLIEAENNGADLTKLGVDKKLHGDMAQRRTDRISAGDHAADFPVALSGAGSTAMAKLSGLRTETQGLLGTLDSYLRTPEGKKYANVPFAELPAAARYKMGMASDDEIAKLQSAFSIERYAGTLQLIPGIRRGDIIQKASEHLPIFGKDSLQLMRDKLTNADRFYALNQSGLQKYSTKTGVANSGGATAEPKATHRYNPATGKIEAIP